MKVLKLYILPILLLAASVACFIKAGQIQRDVVFLKNSNIIYQDAIAALNVEQKKQVESMTTNELVTFKQLAESLAYKGSLPLEITVMQGNLIKISPTKAAGAKGILNYYEQMLTFISALSSLPYSMEYKSFCLGEMCPNSFDMTMVVKR